MSQYDPEHEIVRERRRWGFIEFFVEVFGATFAIAALYLGIACIGVAGLATWLGVDFMTALAIVVVLAAVAFGGAATGVGQSLGYIVPIMGVVFVGIAAMATSLGISFMAAVGIIVAILIGFALFAAANM